MQKIPEDLVPQNWLRSSPSQSEREVLKFFKRKHLASPKFSEITISVHFFFLWLSLPSSLLWKTEKAGGFPESGQNTSGELQLVDSDQLCKENTELGGKQKRRKNRDEHPKPGVSSSNELHVAVSIIAKPNPGYIGNMVLKVGNKRYKPKDYLSSQPLWKIAIANQWLHLWNWHILARGGVMSSDSALVIFTESHFPLGQESQLQRKRVPKQLVAFIIAPKT